MVFSSLEFIFIFLPALFGCYYLAPAFMRNAVLLAGSLCFYFVGTVKEPVHFLLLLGSVMVDFYIGLLMERYERRKRMLLAAGVAFHMVCLGMFKYGGFVTGELARYFPSFEMELQLALPIGISFYTFQGISYIADVYRGKTEAEKSLLRFSLYISMFEQLIAGPIVTYSQVGKDLREREITAVSAVSGLGFFVLGLGLKVLLANPIGKLWTDVRTIGFESISTPLAWMGAAAFSFQLYFDFFGYSLMAVGLGRMLGFQLPKNFDFPYLSRSMTEFWRRWHITLGSWFREYVYIPMGGNRNGKLATPRNLLVVWLLTGIWHGAGYNFILWGAVLFTVIILEKYGLKRLLDRVPVIGRIYMLLLIPITWSIFAIDDVAQLKIFFTRLFPFFDQGAWSIFRYDYLKYVKLYWPFFAAGVLFSTRYPFRLLERMKNTAAVWLLLAVVFGASVFCMYRGLDDPFLYFRF